MLVLGARVLAVGRSARVKALVDPFLLIVIASVRLGRLLAPVCVPERHVDKSIAMSAQDVRMRTGFSSYATIKSKVQYVLGFLFFIHFF